ncbi:MAG: hypothetical protein ACOC4L_03775 [Halanaerobium sp.]
MCKEGDIRVHWYAQKKHFIVDRFEEKDYYADNLIQVDALLESLIVRAIKSRLVISYNYKIEKLKDAEWKLVDGLNYKAEGKAEVKDASVEDSSGLRIFAWTIVRDRDLEIEILPVDDVEQAKKVVKCLKKSALYLNVLYSYSFVLEKYDGWDWVALKDEDSNCVINEKYRRTDGKEV